MLCQLAAQKLLSTHVAGKCFSPVWISSCSCCTRTPSCTYCNQMLSSCVDQLLLCQLGAQKNPFCTYCSQRFFSLMDQLISANLLHKNYFRHIWQVSCVDQLVLCQLAAQQLLPALIAIKCFSPVWISSCSFNLLHKNSFLHLLESNVFSCMDRLMLCQLAAQKLLSAHMAGKCFSPVWISSCYVKLPHNNSFLHLLESNAFLLCGSAHALSTCYTNLVSALISVKCFSLVWISSCSTNLITKTTFCTCGR